MCFYYELRIQGWLITGRRGGGSNDIDIYEGGARHSIENTHEIVGSIEGGAGAGIQWKCVGRGRVAFGVAAAVAGGSAGGGVSAHGCTTLVTVSTSHSKFKM